MKKLLLAVLSLVLAALCFAGGGVQEPPTTNLLTDDRIRNTVAVDPDWQCKRGQVLRYYFRFTKI